jgi:hypothetical protein
MEAGCGAEADSGNGTTGTAGNTGVPPIFTDGYFIADHQATRFETIPASWLAAAKGLNVHLMGRSHSTQVTHGMESLEAGDATFAVATGWFSLPEDPGALCIYGAQAGTPYCTFDFYLNNADGIPGNFADAQNIHAALVRSPGIDVSVFYWCRDLEEMSAAAVDAYLVALAALEAQYTNVKFVYVTGNADAGGEAGHRRHENNERIRAWVRLGNERFLFDYEDIISHAWNGSAWEQATVSWNGTNLPFLNPQYDPAVNGPEFQYTHANEAGCRAVAKAFWFLLARIAGWTGE